MITMFSSHAAPGDCWPGLCLQCMEWQPVGYGSEMAWNSASNDWEDISIYGLQVSSSVKEQPSCSPHHMHVDDVTVTIHGRIFMCFRFGKVEDQKEALRLYTVQIPHKRDRRPPPCYLTKWDGKSFLPMLTAPCGTEVVSSLAVR